MILSSVFIFILGTAIGSFLNVLIDRLPQDQSILGRSHCDHCKHTLEWYELLPVVSFIWQRGKSACCHKKLSVQYPAIEMLTGVSFLLIAQAFISVQFPSFTFTWLLIVAYWGIVASCIVIFFADLKFHIIPDSVQFSLLLFALLLKITAATSGTVSSQTLLLSLGEAVKDGVIVMLPILLLFLFTKGKGMGFGDVKLAFTIGFLLTWVNGLVALYIAFVLGAIVGLSLILSGRKKMKSMVAFGPFLIMGMLVMIFAGNIIMSWVKSVYRF